MNVNFGDNDVKAMFIDLGYNGDMLMPADEFKSISKSGKLFTNLRSFTTPASQNIVNTLSFFDTVKINHNWFNTLISSNEMVKERLLGLAFFRRFDYVIFDFINKRIYTPVKVW